MNIEEKLNRIIELADSIDTYDVVTVPDIAVDKIAAIWELAVEIKKELYGYHV